MQADSVVICRGFESSFDFPIKLLEYLKVDVENQRIDKTRIVFNHSGTTFRIVPLRSIYEASRSNRRGIKAIKS